VVCDGMLLCEDFWRTKRWNMGCSFCCWLGGLAVEDIFGWLPIGKEEQKWQETGDEMRVN
jgi:hypothetical protein